MPMSYIDQDPAILPESSTNVWHNLVESLVAYGRPHSPRNLASRELIGVQTAVDMVRPFVQTSDRKLSKVFAATQASHILRGDNSLHGYGEHAKYVERFSDDGARLSGAYGPKVVDQIPFVVMKLIEDRDTRQAVMSLWRERPGDSRDVPCTLSLQFLIRDRKLHCITSMRSSDAWLGWPYDVFDFTMITATVLLEYRKLLRRKIDDRWDDESKVGLGCLRITAGSQHLYESDVAVVGKIDWSRECEPVIFDIDTFEDSRELIDHLTNFSQGGKVLLQP